MNTETKAIAAWLSDLIARDAGFDRRGPRVTLGGDKRVVSVRLGGDDLVTLVLGDGRVIDIRVYPQEDVEPGPKTMTF